MATLVHDDVLDEADMRRRRPTINRLQGNEAAVLFGDYLISHAFHLCCSLDSTLAARRIGAATNIVCEGELQQVHHRGDNRLSLDQYLEIITRKTATLTGTACFLGARYAGAPAETVARLERYGLDVGIAFQITDDVLDITGSQAQMGKTLGRDLAENKLTLPIIHGLSHGSREMRVRIEAALADQPPDRRLLAELMTASGSVAYALQAAARHVESAVGHLEVLPLTDAREALTRLATLIITREV